MTEYIFNTVFLIFGKNNIVSTIYYGNKQGKDIDIFIILVGNVEYNCLRYNDLDITYVGNYWIDKMIKYFDPLLTEPILTGEILYGTVDKIVQKLEKSQASLKRIVII